MTTYTDISTRALLASLHISTWSARKFDKKTTLHVNDLAGADKEAGRYNKHLLSGAVAHKAVLEAAQAARDLHYRETLPWADEGKRLLPTANFDAYSAAMRVRRSAFDLAVNNFLDEYPALRDQARGKLGTLFDEKDFPPTREVAARFAWAVTFDPVPAQGDVRLDLPADQVAVIAHGVAARVEAAAKAAMIDAWERLREAVARIQKATGDDGIVRPTLIENARMVCDTLKRLNVAQDEQLEVMRERVEQELTTLAIEDLRTDDALRADTERRAKEILEVMGALQRPSRHEAPLGRAAAAPRCQVRAHGRPRHDAPAPVLRWDAQVAGRALQALRLGAGVARPRDRTSAPSSLRPLQDRAAAGPQDRRADGARITGEGETC